VVTGKGLSLGDIPIRFKVQIFLGANNFLELRLPAKLESYPIRVKGALCMGPGFAGGYTKWPCVRKVSIIKKRNTCHYMTLLGRIVWYAE
jgi:hypothetical protein